jgi:hypothetical protein
MSKTNFTQIPNEAITDQRLDAYDFKLLVRIFSYDKLHRTTEYLSEELKISQPRIRKSFEHLKECGWIFQDQYGKWYKNWDNTVPATTLQETATSIPATTLQQPATTLQQPATTLHQTCNDVAATCNHDAENSNDVAAYNKIKENKKENTLIINASGPNPFPLSYFEQNPEAINKPKIRRQAFWHLKKDLFISNGMSEPPTDDYGVQKFDNLIPKINLISQYKEWGTKLEKHLAELEIKKQGSSFILPKARTGF